MSLGFNSFLCVHICTDAWAHVCPSMWRPEIDTGSPLSHLPFLVFETGSLGEPGAHWVRLAGQWIPSILLLWLLGAGTFGWVPGAWLLCKCSDQTLVPCLYGKPLYWLNSRVCTGTWKANIFFYLLNNEVFFKTWKLYHQHKTPSGANKPEDDVFFLTVLLTWSWAWSCVGFPEVVPPAFTFD